MSWRGALAWRRYPRSKPEESKVLVSHPTLGVMEARWNDKGSQRWGINPVDDSEGFSGPHGKRLPDIEHWSYMPPGPNEEAQAESERQELRRATERSIERDIRLYEERTGDTVVDISFEESRQRQVIVHIRRE